ncbi:type II toxin-antitoxin system RelB/DinJ family antitoxin [Gardnerella sp. Marseille-Q2328]|uniref:type II toxin-antitoxin system RelB/DinJ family antitoxin n=1 Tax=Gardnerella sp. Marseille-Q2328 TaxID=2759694 RepID=UPI002023E9F8|nr:type II toxin-antitoxin system RelB/DinJ family antitoxin [Gardnerella sp. Marseille-Q2328]
MKGVFMVVSTVARINFRTDEKTKQDAEVLFDALGLDMSTALNMFLKQAVREQALPISPSLVRSVPNEATLKAMNHANQIMNGKIAEDGIVFSNANEAKAFLDNMS